MLIYFQVSFIKNTMKNYLLLVFVFSISLGYAQRDYRSYQSPVKNQGTRGTCTAFGVAAAIETQPAIPADVSEQYLYAALKYSQPDKTYSEGDFLKNYIPSLQQYGVVHESVMPYEPSGIKWENAPTEFMRKIQGTHAGPVGLLDAHRYAKYGFKDEIAYYDAGQTQNIENIKNALDSGVLAIALHYTYIHVGAWVDSNHTALNPLIPTINIKVNDSWQSYLNLKKTYTGNIVDDIINGKLTYALQDPSRINEKGETVSNYGGHVVTVVGYNDKGFIFKNSWGTDWGDKGYGYISFDAHRIMAREALFFNGIQVYNTELLKKTNTGMDIRLKSSGNYFNEKAGLMFSIFTTAANSNIDIESVHYAVYGMDGKLLSEKKIDQANSTYNTYLWEPFKETLMPPYFLEKAGFVKVIATVTMKGKLYTYTYRCVNFMAQEYGAQEQQNETILKGTPTITSSYKEFLPDTMQDLGFNYPLADFRTALDATNLNYNANKTLEHFIVTHPNAPFEHVRYYFEKENPVLTRIELLFKNEELAKAYTEKHYPKTKNYLGQELGFKQYDDKTPYQVIAWQFENRIYVVTNMYGTKYSNQ